jgi:hypothetical protein
MMLVVPAGRSQNCLSWRRSRRSATNRGEVPAVLGVAGDRFTSFAVYFDQMELLTQLGLAPAPTMTPS